MVTIIDGMNVIGANPDGWWRDRPRARLALVNAIAMWCAGPGPDASTVTVVFDGHPSDAEVTDARARGIDVRYARGGPNAADDVIAQIVGTAGEPGDIVVVTSDIALAARVRDAGAQVEGSKGFRARVGLRDRR